MTKNDDAMEELVGELIGGILPNLNILKEYSAKYRKEGDRHAEHEMTMATAENIVGYLITRILQAVREGKLDRELGVVGRAYTTKQGWDSHTCPMYATPKELEVIALSPESHRDPQRGGQEEEG